MLVCDVGPRDGLQNEAQAVDAGHEVELMHGLGIETGIDLAKLRAAGRTISAFLGRATSSRVAKALDAKVA